MGKLAASIIIPLWNGRKYIETCLAAVLAQDSAPMEVIVVDNASEDGSAEMVAQRFPGVKLICNQRNLGFAGGCNTGLREAKGDILILLNQDTIVQPGWLAALLDAFENRQVGIAGCKILEADGKTLNHCGGSVDLMSAQTWHRGAGEQDKGQYDQAVDTEYVTGAAFAIRRAVVQQIGLLDERFFPGYYEDIDFCLRTRDAGYRLRYVPQAVVLHHVSSSTNQHWIRRRFYYYRNRLLFVLKYLTLKDFTGRFVVEELERLEDTAGEELYAVQLALIDVLGQWHKVEMDDETPFQTKEAAFRGLQTLLGSAVSRHTQPDLTPIVPALDANRSQKEGAIGVLIPVLKEMTTATNEQNATLAKSIEAWRTEEQLLQVRRSPVKAARAAGRILRNVLSAKWRLLTALQQQARLNELINRSVQALAAEAWDDGSVADLRTQQHGLLTSRMLELETRLEKLEAQLRLRNERNT